MKVFERTTRHKKYTSHAKKRKRKATPIFGVTQCKNSPYLSKVPQ